MRKYWKQHASTIVLSAVLIPAIYLAQFARSLRAQSQTSRAGIPQELLAKAKAGDAGAQCDLGMIYAQGQDVPKDYLQAATWFRKAAEQGETTAEYNLGVLYDDGDGVSRDYVQAAKWFRNAAEKGDPNAQYSLGVLYAKGRGVTQDYAQAAVWYRKAADGGDANAQNQLGVLYYFGHGVPEDYAQAANWYRKAAEQGDANAQFTLALLYDRGQGVPLDYVQAAVWFHKAAAQGNAAAQSILGDMYYLGQGVGQDDSEATAWYRRAADNGDARAKSILPLLNERAVIAGSSANRGVTGSPARTALSPQAIAKRSAESSVLVVSTDRNGKGSLLGSGFAVGPNLIVTNSHVFQEGRLGFVRKIGSDRVPRIVEKVVLRDKENDIVLLYVPDLGLPSLPIQASEPIVGDTVFTMGNPEGMEGTFSEGLVSALREEEGVRMIQITAPISHGSSGGPVFNIYGEVIGISTSMLSSGQSLNFAVPASAIDALVKRAGLK